MGMDRKYANRHSFKRLVGFIGILVDFLLILQMTGVVFAEGSRDLYPASATGSRADLEWRTSSYGPSGSTILRRTLLKVFAEQNEYILVGSSAVGVASGSTSGDVLIYNPGLVTGSTPGQETVPSPASASFSCDTQRTGSGIALQGQITSRAEELAGPQAISGGGNPVGYIPCYYQAPSTGVYNIVVTGPSGFGSDAQTASTGGATGEVSLSSSGNFNNTQSTDIAAWDATVRSSVTSSTTDLTGRLFTYYLAQITGGNARPLNSSLYIVTLDGFIYRADLNSMDPYGFLFYGNGAGFYNSDGKTPLYHDVLATSTGNSNQLNELQGGVFMAPPQFPIFFNPPDPAALAALGIPTSAAIPNLSTFNFTGTAGGSQSYFGTGGSFSFVSDTNGFFDIVISKDGINFDPTNPANRVIHALGAVGSNTVNWDGKDNSGASFPIGSYHVRSTIHAGELHMALIDVENSVDGGPGYTLLNPPSGCPFPSLSHPCSGAFYDDRGYQTMSGVTVGTTGSILCGTNPPGITSAVGNPFDSTTTQRAFGLSNGSGNAGTPCLGSFGDTKGLDLWTYFPSQAALTIIVIVNTPPNCGSNSTDPACKLTFRMPSTGFAPNTITNLPEQPGDKAYSAMGDLWLEIPSGNIRENIIGVPNSTNGWDVSWLGKNIGFLDGTAFPTWPGNSVLAGHVFDANGKPGPFAGIGKLSWGQQIIVHAWGEKYIYEVRTVNNWVLPTDTRLITKHEEYSWLTLVTCRGYNASTDSYNYRTIVRAVLTKVAADNSSPTLKQ